MKYQFIKSDRLNPDIQRNNKILETRLDKLNEIIGPRVGDYLITSDGSYSRFTYDWGESIQIGGNSGSYYLGEGYQSYSGSLDPAIPKETMELTSETKLGIVWFFRDDLSEAHNAIYYSIPLRVFKLKASESIAQELHRAKLKNND